MALTSGTKLGPYALDGENITAQEILQAKNDLALRDFRQEYMATFESIEGRVYHAFIRDWYCQNGTFNRGNLDASVQDPGPGLPILVGFDFNVNPLCATLSTKLNVQRPFLPVDPETGWPGGQYEMHTWKEYCLPNAGTADMMKVLREDFPGRHLLVFPDPSGRARHTTSANVGETDHSIIRSFGADIYVPQFRTNSDKFNTVNGLSYALTRWVQSHRFANLRILVPEHCNTRATNSTLRFRCGGTSGSFLPIRPRQRCPWSQPPSRTRGR